MNAGSREDGWRDTPFALHTTRLDAWLDAQLAKTVALPTVRVPPAPYRAMGGKPRLCVLDRRYAGDMHRR